MPWLGHGQHRNCKGVDSPGGFSLNRFRIRGKPRTCATIWIEHLGGRNRCRSQGLQVLRAWRLVYVGIKMEPTISGLASLQIV